MSTEPRRRVGFDGERSMHPNRVRVDGRARMCAAAAIVTLLAIAFSGCAVEIGARASDSAGPALPYAGFFTGQYVEGKPLYRFPPIYVVGSRSNARSFGS